MRPEQLISVVAVSMPFVLPLVLVPTIMTLRFHSRKREWQHRERMKALETGQPIPHETAWPAALVCSAIGAGVPISAFLFTWLATLTSHTNEDIWMAPGMVGLGGVIAGATLASQLLGRKPASTQEYAKAAHDPDAFDVVDRRG